MALLFKSSWDSIELIQSTVIAKADPEGQTRSDRPSHSGGNHRRTLPNHTFLLSLNWSKRLSYFSSFFPPFVLFLSNC